MSRRMENGQRRAISKGIREIPGFPVPTETKVNKETRGQQGLKVKRAKKETLVLQVQKAIKEIPAPREKRVIKEIRVLQARMAHLF